MGKENQGVDNNNISSGIWPKRSRYIRASVPRPDRQSASASMCLTLSDGGDISPGRGSKAAPLAHHWSSFQCAFDGSEISFRASTRETIDHVAWGRHVADGPYLRSPCSSSISRSVPSKKTRRNDSFACCWNTSMRVVPESWKDREIAVESEGDSDDRISRAFSSGPYYLIQPTYGSRRDRVLGQDSWHEMKRNVRT